MSNKSTDGFVESGGLTNKVIVFVIDLSIIIPFLLIMLREPPFKIVFLFCFLLVLL